MTLLGSMTSPVLVASRNNCHRKRKFCTMTWGRTEPRGTVRSGLPSLLQQCPPPWRPGTALPHRLAPQQPLVSLEPDILAMFPGAVSGNSSLKCSSEGGRSCLEWNCPPAPTGPAGMAQLLPTLTPATRRSQQPHASSTSPAGFFCSPGWDFGSERTEEGCEMCLGKWKNTASGEKLCKLNCD